MCIRDSYKDDGSETEAAGDLTQLSGAVFKLEKFNGDTWEVYNPDQPTFTMNSHEGDSSYTSGYLEPGQYRITEVTAPVYSYTDSSSTQKVITFSLLELSLIHILGMVLRGRPDRRQAKFNVERRLPHKSRGCRRRHAG